MDIGLFASKGVVFPGKAGELQDGRLTSELVAELGDNYDRYHAFLESELGKLGRPRRSEYPDYDTYITAYAKAQTLVWAEVLLRNCVAARRSGGGPSTQFAMDMSHSLPFVDRSNRLVRLP
jgi:hypothetical protein